MFKNLEFREDLQILIDKLGNESFAFSRFGDGEMRIIQRKFIDLLSKNTGEFKYDPNDIAYEKSRRLLKKSLTMNQRNYFIGISCPCCVGMKKHLSMLTFCNLPCGHVTWANLFVNSNYYYSMTNITKKIRGKKVYLVSNKHSRVDKLPFKVHKHYAVDRDAWKDDLVLIEKIKEEIVVNNCNGCIFLFCAGPWSNIACCELFEFNCNNTYIDCGSIFDVLLDLGRTRGYLKGAPTLQKICTWS